MQIITVSFNTSQKISLNSVHFGSKKLNLRNKANKNYSSRFCKSLQHYLVWRKS